MTRHLGYLTEEGEQRQLATLITDLGKKLNLFDVTRPDVGIRPACARWKARATLWFIDFFPPSVFCVYIRPPHVRASERASVEFIYRPTARSDGGGGVQKRLRTSATFADQESMAAAGFDRAD